MTTLTAAQLGLSLAAGGLTTLSPCVFPLLPLVVGGSLQGHRAAPVAMGAGMVTSFALLGLLLGLAGERLQLDPEAVRQGAAVLLMALALVLLIKPLNEWFSRMLSPLATGAHQHSGRFNASTLGGAFGLGTLLGLVWSPCSGPMLGTALALVASGPGAVNGVVLLGLFGLGAALPLMAVAYASRNHLTSVRGWVLAHGDQARQVFGAVLLLVGLAILSGADRLLEAAVTQALPASWIEWTTRF